MVAADGGGQLHGPGRATLAECRVRPAALAGSEVRGDPSLLADVEALLEPHPLRRLRARFRVLNRHRIKRRRSRRQQR